MRGFALGGEGGGGGKETVWLAVVSNVQFVPLAARCKRKIQGEVEKVEEGRARRGNKSLQPKGARRGEATSRNHLTNATRTIKDH